MHSTSKTLIKKRFSYSDLLKKAMNDKATYENYYFLEMWLSMFKPEAWDGERYDLGNGYGLYPIEGYINESDPLLRYKGTVDYKIKQI